MKLRKKCDIAFLMKMVNKKIVIFVHIHRLNIIQFSKNVTYCLCFNFFFGVFEYLDYVAFVKREQFIRELFL